MSVFAVDEAKYYSLSYDINKFDQVFIVIYSSRAFF